MKKVELLLKNVEISGEKQDVLINEGKILEIGSSEVEAEEVVDCSQLWVIPGVIDPHVHIRDMEQAHKEDWRSGSEAAINGGVTMVFDMPNTIPSTTTQRGLNRKRKAAEQSKVNYRLYLGGTNKSRRNLAKILETQPEDVIGIKIFLSSSSDNDILTNVTEMRKIFELALKHRKVLTIHTEVQKFIAPRYKYPLKIENHNTIRGRKAAITGLEICLQLAKSVGTTINIAHVTTKEEVEMIRNARAMGEKVYCEVAPHHLLLDESICSDLGNLVKVNPPLRTKEDCEALWEGINNYTIDMIGSDHAPHSAREKRYAYSTAPAGIPGLDTSLRLLLTSVNAGKISRERFVDLVSTKAVSVFGLGDYGKIKEGNEANITIIDINQKGIIRGRRNRSKARFTPFEGFQYTGSPVYTIVNGKLNEIIK